MTSRAVEISGRSRRPRRWKDAPATCTTEEIEAATIPQPLLKSNRQQALLLRALLVTGFWCAGDVELHRIAAAVATGKQEREQGKGRECADLQSHTGCGFASVRPYVSANLFTPHPLGVDHGPMDERRKFLVVGAVVAFILLGWYVISALQRQQKIDDCLLSHRPNCEAYVDAK
jgi:hypothetical protein